MDKLIQMMASLTAILAEMGGPLVLACQLIMEKVEKQAKEMRVIFQNMEAYCEEMEKELEKSRELARDLDIKLYQTEEEVQVQAEDKECFRSACNEKDDEIYRLTLDLRDEKQFSQLMTQQVKQLTEELERQKRVVRLASYFFNNWKAVPQRGKLNLEDGRQDLGLKTMVSHGYSAGWGKVEMVIAVRTLLGSGLKQAKELVEFFGYDWTNNDRS